MAGERLKEALGTYRRRHRVAQRKMKSKLLDELCAMTGYHRKYAMALLNRPEGTAQEGRRRRAIPGRSA